jgi:hypothetical protein
MGVTIKIYSFIFVRITIEDNAIDENNEHNKTTDWSNPLFVYNLPYTYDYLNPKQTNGKISPKIAYPFAQIEPEPAPGYVGIPKEIIETGWYVTYPILEIPVGPSTISFTIYRSNGDNALTPIYSGTSTGTFENKFFSIWRWKI